MALNPESDTGPTVTTGPLTVPESETLRALTPGVATVRLPARDPPCVEETNRTWMVVLGKTPALLGWRVSASVLKLVPSSECSKPCPAGKVNVTAPGNPVPETVYVRAGVEGANSAVVIDDNDDALTLSVGATTVPDTVTVGESAVPALAPWADTVTLPARLTAVDEDASRTAMLWFTAPATGTKLCSLAAKLLPPSTDNSKPTGALTATLPSKRVALTVKTPDSEGVAKRADMGANVLVFTVTVGSNMVLGRCNMALGSAPNVDQADAYWGR